jgi:predicted dienelactone hydrolase
MADFQRLAGLCGAVVAIVIGSHRLPADDAVDYDPRKSIAAPQADPIRLTVNDTQRNREIPLVVHLPQSKTPAAIVLFSHGLGGSAEMSPFLGRHWAGRGYVTVYVQHPGSDDSVWRDKPLIERMAEMRRAANLENSLLRFKDIPAVLDQLAVWNAEPGHALHGRLNLDKVGMSGHSFGAVTTQAVSGQSFGRGRQSFTDPRIKAAILMSPSSPAGQRFTPADAFGEVRIPWLLMTGTQDTSPIGGQTVESRLAVYPALPPGEKYELVLHKAEHSAFTERALPGEQGTRNPNHHRAILALSTAFWDAYLLENSAAREWLNGDGPRAVLESEDRWQKK